MRPAQPPILESFLVRDGSVEQGGKLSRGEVREVDEVLDHDTTVQSLTLYQGAHAFLREYFQEERVRYIAVQSLLLY